MNVLASNHHNDLMDTRQAHTMRGKLHLNALRQYVDGKLPPNYPMPAIRVCIWCGLDCMNCPLHELKCLGQGLKCNKLHLFQ